MDDDAAKDNLHTYLKHEREAVLAKLEGQRRAEIETAARAAEAVL